MRNGEALLDKSNPPNNLTGMAIGLEQKGGLMIRYLWGQGTDCILNVRVVNKDMSYYLHKTLYKSLAVTETKN